jgi:hypothetical protein
MQELNVMLITSTCPKDEKKESYGGGRDTCRYLYLVFAAQHDLISASFTDPCHHIVIISDDNAVTKLSCPRNLLKID